MKKLKLNIIMASLVFSLASCSSDWLNTEPTNQTSPGTIFSTTEQAKSAVNGLCKLMSTPFPYYVGEKLSSQDFNGEGSIKMIYGNWMGNEFVFTNRDGYWVLFKGTNYMSNKTSIYCYYPWWYYYMIIGNANTVIENIDNAQGAESERQFIKAQALTFRAYSYTMLAQLYCNRWADSNKGAAQGLVLKLDTSLDGAPTCTMAQLYEQIYKDLDEAIADFSASRLSRSERDNYSPDLSVAYAVYARASLNRQDYATALSMASKARAGYKLMTNEEYRSGFNEPNSEWIWSSYSSPSESNGYYSFFSRMAYNTINTTYQSRKFCISRELFNQIPSTDIRKSLFLDGEGYSFNQTGTASAGYAAKGTALYNKAFELHPDLPSTHYVYAYMQFKFKAIDGNGQGYLNHIRASEMVLVEAEANYFLGNTEAAQKDLVELNHDSGRDPQYACNKTGDELLKEIKRYRKLELWGEGFDWFDMKRWNDPIDHKTYAKGGNYTDKTAFKTEVTENNKWTWIFPSLETDYNDNLK